MTRAEKRKEKKNYGKDFASFCRTMKRYFPGFIDWLKKVKDPRKFWTYETEPVLMTVIMKNVCCIDSMQQMTDEFINDVCVKNLCTVLGIPEHESLPHYVTLNGFLSRLDPQELEGIRKDMVRTLLRRRKFERARLLGKYWMAIFDATGLFHFKERHCLKKTVGKGSPDGRAFYYHHVLEAKIVPGDGLVVSISTEFIENGGGEVSKNDCETNASKRLAKKLKKDFPRLPICVLADSLERAIVGAYPRKGKANKKLHMEWVPGIDYRGHSFTLLALEVEKTDARGETGTASFQWLTDLTITHWNAEKFANAGRGRRCIENEGFNIQKNVRYGMQHANSMDYNAMKYHYLLTQIADILMQLYERGRPGIREVKHRIKNISSDLLKSFGELLTGEDISFITAYGYMKAV